MIKLQLFFESGAAEITAVGLLSVCDANLRAQNEVHTSLSRFRGVRHCRSHLCGARLDGQGGADRLRCDSQCIFTTPKFDANQALFRCWQVPRHPPEMS